MVMTGLYLNYEQRCGLNQYGMEYSPWSVEQALKIINILRCGSRILLCNAMAWLVNLDVAGVALVQTETLVS